MTFIENAVALDEIARVLKTTVPAVEAEALELNVFVGTNWAGRPALSVFDAAGIISGDERRAQDASASWQAHEAAREAHEAAREGVRRDALQLAYDNKMRLGHGAAAATEAGHRAARDALEKWDAAHRPPTFDGAATTPASWFAKTAQRVKAGVR